mmetsp:Transcript_18402/g.41984  ORF Transcript_18402/g.41984 Transcript_18402/m.41984 type:complete len:957 (-) Transcript_18402:440-3310(-)
MASVLSFAVLSDYRAKLALFCLPIAFSRLAVPAVGFESWRTRGAHALLVLVVAIGNRLAYERPGDSLAFSPLVAVVLWSYLSPRARSGFVAAAGAAAATAGLHFEPVGTLRAATACVMAWGVVVLLGTLLPGTARGTALRDGAVFVAAVAVAMGSGWLDSAARYLLPLDELFEGYLALESATSEVSALRRDALELLVLTAHIQIAIGFLGIEYLRACQVRKIRLLNIAPAQTSDASDAASLVPPSKINGGTKESTQNGNAAAVQDDSKGCKTGKGAINALERVTLRDFLRASCLFVLTSALPYMGARIFFASANSVAFRVLQRKVEANFLTEVFFDESGGKNRGFSNAARGIALGGKSSAARWVGLDGESRAWLSGPVAEVSTAWGSTASSTVRLRDANLTMGVYLEAIHDISDRGFSLVQRKVFSLPKLALFPGLFMARPAFVALVLPISVCLDAGKSWLSAKLTTWARELRTEARDRTSKRTKIFEHDMRHEEQINLSGGAAFTRFRWDALSEEISNMKLRAELFETARSYLNWLYWSDILSVGIEVMIASILESSAMDVADVWVSQRVIEDAIDALLMRSRAEADLASMRVDRERIAGLVQAWTKRASGGPPTAPHEPGSAQAGARALLSDWRGQVACERSPSAAFEVSGVTVSRGTASVRLESLRIEAGNVVAVTGHNGCGKSTLFSMLAAAPCAQSPVPLPDSVSVTVEAGAFLRLPGAAATETVTETASLEDRVRVATLSQRSYHPLFARPVEWFLATGTQEAEAEGERATLERATAARVASLASDLGFVDAGKAKGKEPASLGEDRGRAWLLAELTAESEDWHGSLSGGQRSKAEFVRSVFLAPECPDLVLIDEGFAALDPRSKAVVQSRLKRFCSKSLLLVVYHSDTEESAIDSPLDLSLDSTGGSSNSTAHGCVPSNGFFTLNLHVEQGVARLRPLCALPPPQRLKA